MSTSREVAAQAIGDYFDPDMASWDTTRTLMADAVLAALREHWTSDEVVERIYIYEYTPSEVRSVIAALFEETP